MVLERSAFYHLEHYEYGVPYYGSYKSVYYRLGLEPLENVHWSAEKKAAPHVLRAYVWSGPFAYSETPEEEKRYRDFPWTDEGLNQAVDWLDSQCEGAPELKLL